MEIDATTAQPNFRSSTARAGEFRLRVQPLLALLLREAYPNQSV